MGSKLKELLDLVRARSSLRGAPLREAKAEAERLSDSLELDSGRRGENSRLLRSYMEATQEDFRKMLGVSSQSEYSKIERGEAALGESQVKLMELELGLAAGWFDRNNSEGLFLTNNEMVLIRELRRYPTTTTEVIVSLFKTFEPK